MKYLFLDESGDHNLRRLDPHHPIFVLGGCILDQEYYDSVFEPTFRKFKKDALQNENAILHYADYTRNRNGFERISEKAFRENFFKNLNELVKETDFLVLSAIIDKKKHYEKYGLLASDPYHFSLELIVERFVFYLNEVKDCGRIIVESRNDQLDNALELAYLNTRVNGTAFLTPKSVVSAVDRQLSFKNKKDNIGGLQLADTIVTPVARKYLGRKNFYHDYDVIKSKFRKNYCGKYKGFGLVVLPK